MLASCGEAETLGELRGGCSSFVAPWNGNDDTVVENVTATKHGFGHSRARVVDEYSGESVDSWWDH